MPVIYHRAANETLYPVYSGAAETEEVRQYLIMHAKAYHQQQGQLEFSLPPNQNDAYFAQEANLLTVPPTTRGTLPIVSATMPKPIIHHTEPIGHIIYTLLWIVAIGTLTGSLIYKYLLHWDRGR